MSALFILQSLISVWMELGGPALLRLDGLNLILVFFCSISIQGPNIFVLFAQESEVALSNPKVCLD